MKNANKLSPKIAVLAKRIKEFFGYSEAKSISAATAQAAIDDKIEAGTFKSENAPITPDAPISGSAQRRLTEAETLLQICLIDFAASENLFAADPQVRRRADDRAYRRVLSAFPIRKGRQTTAEELEKVFGCDPCGSLTAGIHPAWAISIMRDAVYVCRDNIMALHDEDASNPAVRNFLASVKRAKSELADLEAKVAASKAREKELAEEIARLKDEPARIKDETARIKNEIARIDATGARCFAAIGLPPESFKGMKPEEITAAIEARISALAADQCAELGFSRAPHQTKAALRAADCRIKYHELLQTDPEAAAKFYAKNRETFQS